ncbi:Sorting and assembly machinery component 50, partial [Orchesella cincta]
CLVGVERKPDVFANFGDRYFLTMETIIPVEATLDLEGVPVRVKNINFDGLGRTKGDFVAEAVKEIFLAKNFGDLLQKVGNAQDKLSRLETFREVSAVVDVHNISEIEDYKIGDDYDVTFIVKEFSRLAASAKTQMGAQADAQVKTGIRMPNVFGRGEKLEVEYSYSSGSEKNSEISFLKPFPQYLDSSFKTSVFQTRSPNVHAKYMNKAIGSIMSFSCSTFLQLLTLHHKVEWEATWREIVPENTLTPYSIRLECGHAIKSALRHTVTLDSRDRQVFPSKGTYINFLQELAGIGGDAKYHKLDFDLQYNYPLPLNMVFQTSFRVGKLTPFGTSEKSCGIADRFFMGGPYSLRGFCMRGLKIGQDGLSLGGLEHWSAAAHLYTPLPSVNRKFPIIDSCRLHFFVNAGNLADKFLAGNIFKDIRIAYGAGLAVGMGDFARLELNYCLPIRQLVGDKPVKGFQVGVGIHFL